MSLTKVQLDSLTDMMRARLATLETEIAQKINESSDQLTSVDRTSPGDLAQALADSEIDLSEANRDIDEWRGLTAALRRVADDHYGICVDCGVEIPFERLEVQPVALRCIDCQSKAEKAATGQPRA